MPTNQLFPDWVTGDPITADRLNQMKNDLIPWSQAGQANGPATLDSAGKLVQPRRVLDAAASFGGVGNGQTTADVGQYVLPSPRVSVSVDAGQRVMAWGNAFIRDRTNVTHIYAQLMLSADGGTTWSTLGNPFGTYAPTVDTYYSASGVAVFEATTPGSIMLGLSIGNPPGTALGHTIDALLNKCSLGVIVVEV